MSRALGSILVVEDDVAVGTVLVKILEQNELEATHVASAEDALRVLDARAFDVVLSDVRMPGMNGLELLGELGRRFPDLPVVLLTAHGSVPMAVEAMKNGAADFLLKPFERDEILFVVRKALTRAQASQGPARSIDAAPGIVGSSSALQSVLATVRKVAANNATVLVTGETGTGKELVARALHDLGPRKAAPFVAVNCGALPETLLESELFGYEKGAFTGAAMRKPGRIELATGGTLFLDEIGDIPLHVQVKLLRVLQERAFERVGGTETIHVDVRFVAATHRDLAAMVAEGRFREDLFYRLNVVPIRVPPLRERGDDIELLAHHFARTFAKESVQPDVTLENDAAKALRAHSWPGNVRELENMIERLVVLSDGPKIHARDVARELATVPLRPSAPGETVEGATLDEHRVVAEKDALLKALARAKNNRSLAARLLNVSRRTLYNKLKEHGVE